MSSPLPRLDSYLGTYILQQRGNSQCKENRLSLLKALLLVHGECGLGVGGFSNSREGRE